MALSPAKWKPASIYFIREGDQLCKLLGLAPGKWEVSGDVVMWPISHVHVDHRRRRIMKDERMEVPWPSARIR